MAKNVNTAPEAAEDASVAAAEDLHEELTLVQEAASEAEQPGVDTEESELTGIDGKLAVILAQNGLNMREGPGFTFDILCQVPDAAVVVVLPLPYGVTVPHWALVHTGQAVGWVATRYIRMLEV